jgi:F420-0:gamma-glutamyl ligase
MNKRFKELAERAYKDVNTNTPSFLVTKEMVDARFAELLIKECASIVDQRPNVLIDQTTGGWLREQFGVAEDD